MNHKRFLAALISITMIGGTASCGTISSSSEKSGSDPETTTVSDLPSAGSSSSDVSGSSTEEETSESSESSTKSSEKNSQTTAKANNDNKTTSTTAKNSGSSSSSGTASASSGNSSSGSGNSSSGSSSSGQSSGGNTSGSSSSGGNSSSGNSSSGGSSSGSQEQQSPTDAPSDEKVYTAEITLGSSPKVTGENVSVSGSVVTITAGGDYRFSGKMSGQICVDTATEEDVTVILDGVDISNSSGPAILVNEAKKCTIKVREGTVNTLSDGGNDKINNGVIFSNDTLRFKGNGTLNINSGNAHGISSDDDIIIENGIYNIKAVKTGLTAHDDVTINGGTLDIKGGTNGIKSKGTININGGSAIVSGGTKEEKSSIYAAGSFNYTGGYLFAAGNLVSAPTYSNTPYIIVDLGESVSAGSKVEMVLDGTQMVSFAPHNSFRSLMMLAPEIAIGSSFYTVVNGSSSDSVTVEDGKNIFSLN